MLTLNSCLTNTPTDSHYHKLERHPQLQTTKKCMERTPAISDSRYYRIADDLGGPNFHCLSFVTKDDLHVMSD